MKRLLLIDQQITQTEQISTMFAENNDSVQIQHLMSRADALAYLEGFDRMQVRHIDLPSLIILDINLPEAEDGIKLLDKISKIEKLKNIPLFVFTGNADKDIIASCYVRGANGYFLKPTENIQLQKVVKILSDRWQQLIQRGFGYSYKAV